MPLAKPPFGLFNRAHPLAKGLSFCWSPCAGYQQDREVIQQNDPSTISSSGIVGGLYGAARRFNGTSGAENYSARGYADYQTQFCIVLILKLNSTAQANAYIFHQQTAALNNNKAAILYGFVANTFEFFAGGYTGTDPRLGTQISVNDQLWHVLAYNYDGATLSGYLDGLLKIAVATTFSLAANVGPTQLGNAAGSNFANVDLGGLLIYPRSLSQNEIALLSADPFAMLRTDDSDYVIAAGASFQPAWAARGGQVVGVGVY